MAVKRNGRTHLTSQQLVDGDTKTLPQDVPQCAIDAAQRNVTLWT
jgi:hypothetical protein